MSFKEDLEQEYLDNLEKEKATEKQRHENLEKETKAQFTKFFGVYPDSVDGEFAQKDSFNFRWSYRYGKVAWAFVSDCPKCGGKCISSYHNSRMQLLKEVFEKFEPTNHRCNIDIEENKQPTTEEKLIELLRDFVYEHTQQ